MSLLSLFRATVSTARISIPTVVESLFGVRDPRVYDARLVQWARALTDEAHVDVSVQGEFPSSGSYLVLSNHQSLYDIPVLFAVSPLPLRMAAKAELFRIPIWGRAMKIAGFVPIDRSRGREARERLRLAAEQLSKHGRSLWMAPEGTRGDGAVLGSFRTGAFELAHDLKLPILPISVDGTAKILGKGERVVRRGVRVNVKVHAVIHPAEYPDDYHQLRDRVRTIIESGITRAF